MTNGPWWMVGPAIGLLVVLMLWTLNKPLGALGGWVDLEAWLRGPSRAVTWRLWFLLGVMAGGLAYAVTTGGFAPGVANAPLAARLGGGALAVVLTSLLAGAAIGFGARVASGCTSGHGISGTALGSPASIVSSATFMGVAVATAHAILWLSGGA